MAGRVAPRARAGHWTGRWTGRAATSRATDSGLPLLLVSARTHRTRVSEMRGFAARPAAHAVRRAPAPMPPARSALVRPTAGTP
ncbi:hypothetical protein rosag_16710 [Roseisolibacter agri]|uniref:Uncharacterized protein n=2 Tax=Roseisolibacter agri TaxID=2014610 RepID=A0AA37QEA3_9BACT|nr:hypothetical protein rosag_16710 [Roseisolibacter agri]